MKKSCKILSITLAVLLLLTSVFALAACNPNEQETEEPNTPENPSNPETPSTPTTPSTPEETERPTVPEMSMKVGKIKYYLDEEIYVTATGKGDAWIGIFLADEDVTEVGSIMWYYVARNGWINGQTYGFRKSAVVNQTRATLANLPAGKYQIVYFTDDTRNSAWATVDVEITSEVMPAPTAVDDVEYRLYNQTDGLAAGTVTFTYNNANPVEEAVMYWADGNCKPLEGYASIAPYKLTGNGCVIELPERMLIPAEAKKLIVYSWNSTHGMSKAFCVLDLPEGCQYQAEGELLSEFQIVSDIHIDYELPTHLTHFQQMCQDIVANSPNSGGVFVNGDTANTSQRYQWEWLTDTIAQYSSLPKFHFGVGNHDYMYDTVNGRALYYEFAGVEREYFEVVVNGYHHVFLGSELDYHEAYLTDTQLQWFDETMSRLTAAEPNKPVFVYLHQSLYDTCAGGLPGQLWNGVVQDDELRAIVAKYKQIYFFNGHSHWVMNSYRNMYVGNSELPNIFNTAAVGYLWTDFYTPEGVEEVGSQGYYVRVYQDKVLVLARDFVNGKWIPCACYVATFDGIGQ